MGLEVTAEQIEFVRELRGTVCQCERKKMKLRSFCAQHKKETAKLRARMKQRRIEAKPLPLLESAI